MHAVWATKDRRPLLTSQKRAIICEHIKESAKAKDIYIAELDGYTEHLHCLMCLRPELAVSRQMQLLKGESSWWINKQGIFPEKFDWGNEYFAASVSGNDLGWLKNYIRNQELHHRNVTFAQEYSSFLASAKFVEG